MSIHKIFKRVAKRKKQGKKNKFGCSKESIPKREFIPNTKFKLNLEDVVLIRQTLS